MFWIEVGWFWGCLGRERIMILCKGELEISSDIEGIEFHYYKEKPEEAGKKIDLFIKN